MRFDSARISTDSDGRFRLSYPVRPRSCIELRTGDSGHLEREKVCAGADPRSAVDKNLFGILERGKPFGLGSGFEASVRLETRRPVQVDRTGNVSGFGIYRFDLAPVTRRGPRIDQDCARTSSGHIFGVHHHLRTHPRCEGRFGMRWRVRLEGSAHCEPRKKAAIEHADPIMPEVTQQPPDVGGVKPLTAAGIVVGDQRMFIADAKFGQP